MRGCLWLTAGLVLALVAGVVAWLALRAAIEGTGGVGEGVASGQELQVVMAASVIEVRSVLTTDNVLVRNVPADAVPEGAVPVLEQAVGRITLVDLYPGEIILAQQLVDPNVITGDGRLALVVAEDEVLMAVPAQDLMSRIDILKPGDHIDLLFSLDFPVDRGLEFIPEEEGEGEGGTATGSGGQQGDEQVTFNLLENIVIAAIVASETSGAQSGAPQALLLTVSPQDALLLKYAWDAGGNPTIVLRAPGAEEPADTDPVDIDYMIRRYRIPTESGR
jgi:pilus assembly protein CpaB